MVAAASAPLLPASLPSAVCLAEGWSLACLCSDVVLRTARLTRRSTALGFLLVLVAPLASCVPPAGSGGATETTELLREAVAPSAVAAAWTTRHQPSSASHRATWQSVWSSLTSTASLAAPRRLLLLAAVTAL